MSFGSPADGFRLLLINSSTGTAGDLFSRASSTISSYNKQFSATYLNCTSIGGWWYHDLCHYGKLTGLYYDPPGPIPKTIANVGVGVSWFSLAGKS